MDQNHTVVDQPMQQNVWLIVLKTVDLMCLKIFALMLEFSLIRLIVTSTLCAIQMAMVVTLPKTDSAMISMFSIRSVVMETTVDLPETLIASPQIVHKDHPKLFYFDTQVLPDKLVQLA